MAKVLGLLPSALRFARAGLTATAWINSMRLQGLAGRDAEMRALYQHAVEIVSKSGNEIGARQGQVPSPSERTGFPTKNATGVRQVVTILYRNRSTGHISSSKWSTITSKGITRSAAVSQAINAYSDHAEAYDQDLIMAVHTAAYDLIPFGF